MNEWPLVLTVVGTLAAVGVLAHRVMVQILGRIDSMAAAMAAQLSDKFEESERRRQDGAALWQERLALRDQAIESVRRDHQRTSEDLDALRKALDNYTLRGDFVALGGTLTSLSLKLDRIYARCQRSDTALCLDLPEYQHHGP